MVGTKVKFRKLAFLDKEKLPFWSLSFTLLTRHLGCLFYYQVSCFNACLHWFILNCAPTPFHLLSPTPTHLEPTAIYCHSHSFSAHSYPLPLMFIPLLNLIPLLPMYSLSHPFPVHIQILSPNLTHHLPFLPILSPVFYVPMCFT